jgi:hypothetical protein
VTANTSCSPRFPYPSNIQKQENIVLLENQYVPHASFRSTATSPEDRRAYKKIIYGIGGIYTAAAVWLVGVVVVGINFQQAAHMVMAAWH